MQAMDDMALLREYATSNSETAFETLVSRRVSFAYSAALRQVRDPYLAEEVTQAVFIILAQKAGRISNKTILAGWLFRTTRFAALAQMRADAKRRQREQEANMQSEIQPTAPDVFWEQMSPLLDEALATLGETDRQAVLLRFFENKSLAEVGRSLGTGEDTARKRVSRALEKLHRYFSKHGVSSTTAIIAGAISANSVQAVPVALAKSITVAAMAKGAAASSSTLTLIQGALKIMAWTKAKTAIVVGAAAVLTVGTTTIIVKESRHSPNKPLVGVRMSQQQFDIAPASQSPMAVFSELRAQGRLPGVSKDERGDLMVGDARTGADLDLKTLTMPTPVKYPWQITINFTKVDFKSRAEYNSRPKYHYTFVKPSENGSWRLQRAWHTDTDGSFIEEFPVP
jgi:RNA polymerase sigma factor (sigma-70 family)